MEPLTKFERDILAFVCSVKNKPNWKVKVRDELIVKKWISEVCREDTKVLDYGYQPNKIQLSDVGIGVALYMLLNCNNVSPANNVFWIENGISVKKDILNNCGDKFNHPIIGSDQFDTKVLNVVHPSLFPMTPDRIVLDKSYAGLKTLYEDFDSFMQLGCKKIEDSSLSGDDYHWIPSTMKLINGKWRYTSYINNMYPNKDSYAEVEKIFNHVCRLLFNAESYRYKACVKADYPFTETQEVDPGKALRCKLKYEWSDDECDDEDCFYEDPPSQVKREPLWKIDYSRIDKNAMIHVSDMVDIKVITKIATIKLEPGEKYDGGSWHIEGNRGDKVIASAIYYYSIENIKNSKLEFRHVISQNEFDYDQNKYNHILELYDFEQEVTTMLESDGYVNVREGLALGWNNNIQHRVSPFELEDPTKPGHRSIITFFLCKDDAIATDVVPPVREDWFKHVSSFPLELNGQLWSWEKGIEKMKTFMSARVPRKSSLGEDDYLFLCEH